MDTRTYPGSTHEDFHRIIRSNPDARVEIDASGTITVTPPAGADSGRLNARLTHAIWEWAESNGYVAFDSSAGFALPDGSIFSPDAALVPCAIWDVLSTEQRKVFFQGAPAVAIELASPSDRPLALIVKLRHLRTAGTDFVAMIDPYRKTIWTDGTPPAGFSIDLKSFLD